MILAVGETIACYIYAAIVDHQLSKVHPSPVNLPPNNQVNLPPNSQVRFVQRLNNDPHVFFIRNSVTSTEVLPQQLPVPEEQTAENALDCTTGFVAMLKTTKIMNIICLVFLINFPITVMTGMTYYNCDNNLGECDHFITLFRFFVVPFKFVSFCFSHVLFLYRLNNANI